MSPDNQILPIIPERLRPLSFQVFSEDNFLLDLIQPELQKYGEVEVLPPEDFFKNQTLTGQVILINAFPSPEVLDQIGFIKWRNPEKIIFSFCSVSDVPVYIALLKRGTAEEFLLTYTPEIIREQVEEIVTITRNKQKATG